MLPTLWHPYQKFWNTDLLAALRRISPIPQVYGVLARGIVVVDTMVLVVRAVARRLAKLGLWKLRVGPDSRAGVPVIYFDMGTHTEAEELHLMVNEILPSTGLEFRAFAFEASRDSFLCAQAKLRDVREVEFFNVALCYQANPGGKIRLYKTGATGLGSSIHRSELADFEDVDAVRFSDWLHDNGIDVSKNACLLRMNVEGAEYDVIRDLVEHDLAQLIDGYYGMWDDVSKIDEGQGKEFSAILRRSHIAPFTFNQRDLPYRVRRWCIEFDVNTCIQAGVRRVTREK